MANGAYWTETLDGLTERAGRLHPLLESILDEAAQAIAAEAAAHSRVKTGSYRNGWYVVTAKRDTYAQSVAASRSVRPKVEIVERTDPSSRSAAIVGNVVIHAMLVEEGGVPGLPGDHTLLRAVETIRSQLADYATISIERGLR